MVYCGVFYPKTPWFFAIVNCIEYSGSNIVKLFMTTEIPSNKPIDSSNTANAVKNKKAASESQLTVTAKSKITESLTNHSASIAVLKLLRTPDGRKKWLDSISAGIINTSFNSADLDELFKKNLA